MVDILYSLRPRQWIKNLLILAPLFFAKKALVPYMVFNAWQAVISFILISSSVYLINDMVDYKRDRMHPEKKNRPIASGRVSKKAAFITTISTFLLSVLFSYFISFHFMSIVLIYYVMQLLYTFWLKHVVLLDVFVISFGFVLRIIAGGVAIHVEISSWILLCTLLGSLFLALAKRKNEIILLSENASSHRKSLDGYSPGLLKQLISIVAGATILAYALYTQDHDTILKFGTDQLMYTIPFVVYGIFRYLYLSYEQQEGGDPSEVFLKDKPMLINIILFLLVVFIILY